MKFLYGLVFSVMALGVITVSWDELGSYKQPSTIPYGNTEPTAIVPLIVELILISPGKVDQKKHNVFEEKLQ